MEHLLNKPCYFKPVSSSVELGFVNTGCTDFFSFGHVMYCKDCQRTLYCTVRVVYQSRLYIAVSKYVMLLSNFEDEHRGLSPVSEVGFRHQLVKLVAPFLWK